MENSRSLSFLVSQRRASPRRASIGIQARMSMACTSINSPTGIGSKC